MRINLPDGGHYNIHVGHNIVEEWYDHECRYHRDDGPAVTHSDGDIEYWVNGEIPLSILDIVIIREEIDYDAFPSAELISNYYDGTDMGNQAYHIRDPDELILAILRYS